VAVSDDSRVPRRRVNHAYDVTLLAPHLSQENCRAVLSAARHKSKREVEEQIAALRPLPPVPPSVHKLPERRSLQETTVKALAMVKPQQPTVDAPVHVPAAPPPKPAVVKPLAPEQYKVQFTISRETHEKLRRAQDLLRHSIPDGDPAKIFDKALALLLADVEKKKFAAAVKPRARQTPADSSTRHIPASVRRAVWKRDGGQCAFVGTKGRCAERGFLEFHHREPFAAGGATTIDNLELRCRAHNAYEAELFFGSAVGREESVKYEASTRSGPSCTRAARADDNGAHA
jgi:5-methylcytosine-specific restriction endonuclease McrA